MDGAIQSFGDMAMTQATLPTAMRGPRGAASGDRAAQDFEAMFMTQMLEPMFQGLDVDPTFGGGHGEKIMRTFLLQEYGKIIAKSGHLGIAASVKSEMIRAQETAAGPTETQGGPHAPTK